MKFSARNILIIYKSIKKHGDSNKMAFLMLLHEKMRLQRKVNKLTLRELKLSSRKERITKNISRVQKMYSSKMTQLEKQAQMAQSQFTVWAQNASGLGMNGLNPMNFGAAGGVSNFILQGLSAWANQGTTDKDGKSIVSADRAATMFQAFQQGGFQQNLGDDNKPIKDAEWKDINGNTYSAQEYQAFQGAYNQVQQMQSYAQMQVQQMSSQYQSNVSIWLEAAKAQLEAEQDAALAPLEAEETDMDLEKESCEAQLADAKARLESIKQACSEGIKDSAPTFGLG